MVAVVLLHSISRVGTPKKRRSEQSRMRATGGGYRVGGCSVDAPGAERQPEAPAEALCTVAASRGPTASTVPPVRPSVSRRRACCFATTTPPSGTSCSSDCPVHGDAYTLDYCRLSLTVRGVKASFMIAQGGWPMIAEEHIGGCLLTCASIPGQASLSSSNDGLRPIGHLELGEDIRHVVLDSVQTERKPGGDGCIVVPAGDEPENLPLPSSGVGER